VAGSGASRAYQRYWIGEVKRSSSESSRNEALQRPKETGVGSR